MADVTLKIIADASDAVKNIKNAQEATQLLADTTKKLKSAMDETWSKINSSTGADNAKNVNKLVTEYNDLQKALKDVQEAEKKLTDSEKTLGQEQSKTGGEVESLTKSVSKMALSFGGATALLKILKEAFTSTTGGMKLFNQVGAVTKQVLNDIVTGSSISVERIMAVWKATGQLADMQMKDQLEMLKNKKTMIEYNKLRSEAADGNISLKDKVDKLTKAKEIYITVTKSEIESEKAKLIKLRKIAEANKGNIVAMEDLVKSKAKIYDLESQLDSGTLQLTRQIAAAEKQAHDEKLDRWYKEIEEQNKVNEKKWQLEEELLKKTKELQDKYEKSNIDSLKGVDKLKAQRDFGVAQITELRNELAALGPISEEQYNMLQTMANNVWKGYYDALSKEFKNVKLTDAQKKEISKGLLEGLPTLEGLQKSTLTGPQIGKAPEEFSIWNLLGIKVDTEEGKQAQEALLKAKDTVINVIDEVYQKRVDDAERRRELLDTQIDETQQELETEIRLYEDGYASNVAAKKKELAELKKQRALALKQEEEAIKRQRQFDTLQQVSALITASAQTFKAFPGPLLPVAIAVVAAMFAAFAATKVRANAATKLAEGGSGTDTGIINGKSHSRGGERFLSQVEVERGEAWGVLSVPATQRYGKVFHQMVSNFNKGQISTPVNKISNSVLVENSGPNSRLDQVIAEQRRLNSKLSGDSIQEFGGMRVIRKGSTVRIISR